MLKFSYVPFNRSWFQGKEVSELPRKEVSCLKDPIRQQCMLPNMHIGGRRSHALPCATLGDIFQSNTGSIFTPSFFLDLLTVRRAIIQQKLELEKTHEVIKLSPSQGRTGLNNISLFSFIQYCLVLHVTDLSCTVTAFGKSGVYWNYSAALFFCKLWLLRPFSFKKGIK